MSPDRGESSNEDLLERIDKTVIGLQRKHEQLEAAFTPYEGEEGHWEFNEHYDSDDVEERNRAELVHTGFERHHQLIRDLVDLSAKLASRIGACPKKGKGQDWLEVLEGEGIISSVDAQLLRENTIVRNESQHAYVEAVSNQVYKAAERQLNDGPKLVAKLGRWVAGLRDQI